MTYFQGKLNDIFKENYVSNEPKMGNLSTKKNCQHGHFRVKNHNKVLTY